MMELTHKLVEEYIVAGMAGTGVKYSLVADNARDFSTPTAPMLIEGSEDHVVFTVTVERSGSAAIGNTYRRLVGTITVECYISIEKSDRNYYKIVDKLRKFLEAASFNGIILGNFTNVAGYKLGKWNVKPSIISFKNTEQRI